MLGQGYLLGIQLAAGPGYPGRPGFTKASKFSSATLTAKERIQTNRPTLQSPCSFYPTQDHLRPTPG